MKKFVSLIIFVVMMLEMLPVFAAGEPFEITQRFSDGVETGVFVRLKGKSADDFVLVASLMENNTLIDVQTIKSSEIIDEKRIAFDYRAGAVVDVIALKSFESMEPAKDIIGTITYDDVMSSLRLVNDYYIKEHLTLMKDSNPWEKGVYHTGNMQAYFMTGDEAYRNYSQKWGEVNEWKSYGYDKGWNKLHADNMCCYQTYLDLYNIEHDERMVEYVNEAVERLMTSQSNDYWNWIDAIYMAAPIMMRMYKMTSNREYLDRMYELISFVAEDLGCCDEETGLWFRDVNFIDKVSENGEKVFWSRGDGWVYAALTHILEGLPHDYIHRDYFIEKYLNLSAALKDVQCDNGAWHESLMDENFNPDCEESGTGFFVYGMLWGINNGYLQEKDYLECAIRGWNWLDNTARNSSGRIGYVQPIGQQPTKEKLTADKTQAYGYANFVFAAGELAKYLGGVQGDVMPYLSRKLVGNIEVYKKGCTNAIKNGAIVALDEPFDEPYLTGSLCTWEMGDIVVVSELAQPFNKSELNLIDVLSEALSEGKFPERAYSDPERFKLDVHYELPDINKVENALIIPKENISYNGSNALTEMLVDRDFDTYCFGQAYSVYNPAQIDINLVSEYRIDKVGIAFANGSEEVNDISVEVSLDGVLYESVIERVSASGGTSTMEYFEFEAVSAKYVRIYGYGTKTGLDFFPSEIEVFSPDGQKAVELDFDANIQLRYEAVEASLIKEAQNGPDKALDGNHDTYFAIYAENGETGQYLEIDLGEVKEIHDMALLFSMGGERKYILSASVSDDGINYNHAVDKQRTKSADGAYEIFDLGGVSARYVRLYGYGRMLASGGRNYWFSLAEIKLFGKEDDKGKARYTPSASSVPQSENPPEHLNDGDLNTYCALYVENEAYPEYVELDLGGVRAVDYLSMGFFSAGTRRIKFSIDVSRDGENYVTVHDIQYTSGNDTGLVDYVIDEEVRYIRIYAYSNTYNVNWVSITEAEVYLKK